MVVGKLGYTLESYIEGSKYWGLGQPQTKWIGISGDRAQTEVVIKVSG